MNNRIISNTVKLLRIIRSSSSSELEDAITMLKTFGDSWLVDGTMNNLPGTNDSCLADTDITEPLREALEVCLENVSS